MLKEFKKFLIRGNMVDLAVGVMIGASFSAIVNSLVKDILTPLISAIARVPDFSGAYFVINDSKFLYGNFLNSLISFFLISVTVFFFIMKPINLLVNKSKKEKDPTTKKCPECLSEIPIEAKRCAHCGEVVTN